MIVSGLYSSICNAPSLIALLGPPSSTANNQPIANSVFFGNAPKTPPKRFLILNIIDELPAGQTLDGPSALIDGELQFDAYSESQLTSQKITKAVLLLFKNWAGALSDGSTIQFTEITMHRDAPYELGGEGYLYRSTLRMRAMFTEPA